MTDVEMKDAAKPADEDKKAEEEKKEEPNDCFYGKLLSLSSVTLLLTCYRDFVQR